MSQDRKPKLVIIGLDGATWDVILPLAEQGKLPAIQRILSEGRRGILQSVIPPLTAPAWATMLTGVDPGEHGIFDMVTYDEALGRARPIVMADWKAKPLWAALNERGFTTGFMGIPFTYPPPNVDGWFISGMMGSPRYDTRMFDPPSLFEEVTDAAGSHPLDLPVPSRVGAKVPMDRLDRQIEWLENASLYLLDHHPVDVLMVVESYTDHLQHYFFKSRTYQHEDQALDIIEYVYRAADRLIGAIGARVGEDVPLLLVSDHGFGSIDGYINIGALKSVLSSAETSGVSKRAFYLFRQIWRSVGRPCLRWLGLDPLAVRERGLRAIKRMALVPEEIRIECYGSIWLKSGRTPVTHAELVEAAEKLQRLTDPRDGSSLFEVLPGSDLYSGVYSAQAPHLLARPFRKLYEFREAALDAPLVMDTEQALRAGVEQARAGIEGMHRPEGIWAMVGACADVGPGPERLADVPRWVLSILEPLHPADRAGTEPSEAQQSASPYSEEERRLIEKRLADLGYL